MIKLCFFLFLVLDFARRGEWPSQTRVCKQQAGSCASYEDPTRPAGTLQVEQARPAPLWLLQTIRFLRVFENNLSCVCFCVCVLACFCVFLCVFGVFLIGFLVCWGCSVVLLCFPFLIDNTPFTAEIDNFRTNERIANYHNQMHPGIDINTTVGDRRRVLPNQGPLTDRTHDRSRRPQNQTQKISSARRGYKPQAQFSQTGML